MIYSDDFLKEISFPLGGIGTGSIGLAGDGRLVDWEIFNKPSKGSYNGYTNLSIRAISKSGITPRVLCGNLMKNFQGNFSGSGYWGLGLGPNVEKLFGLPHFKNLRFNGEFPVATIDFFDDSFPSSVSLIGFNPFIPLDSENSSIPAAFFQFEVENTTIDSIKYEIAFTVTNPFKDSVNTYVQSDKCHCITLTSSSIDPKDVDFGDLTVATDCDDVQYRCYWLRRGWKANVISFWDDFSSSLSFADRNYDSSGEHDHCTLLAGVNVPPFEKRTVKFVLSWNVPNNYNYWSQSENSDVRKPWKNYYATVFENSVSSAIYCLENFDSLYSKTILFKNALYNSSLPEAVINAAASNLSVLKSPTVLRLEDGAFYGWEGVAERIGLCEGTCQHVWNYAYAMCFLFPDLERSIRKIEFEYNTFDDGRMGFRILIPLGSDTNKFRACLDGQMGAVIKCYREWKISGNNEWLRDNWENIKKVLEYAWSDQNPDAWDLDKDGVLEGRQHHTLDVELFGPSSWLEGMYLAALKAASEMAMALGDVKKSEEYLNIFNKGFDWTNENLFNGKYFIHKINLSDKSLTDRFGACEQYWDEESREIMQQIGEGCLLDQMLAQWHADILGLGDIFDKDKVNIALTSMMKNNFKPVMRDTVNFWRIFSADDEAGCIICDYPKDINKPKFPIPYFTETMTGFEYSFAGLLLSRGKIDDGITVVKSVRDRFDGKKRNPWNEFECGSNYARSMSSFALIPILSGFEFDMPNNHIGFNPYNRDNFSCIWSLAEAWGTVFVSEKNVKIDFYFGGLTLKSIGLKFCESISDLRIDGKRVSFCFADGRLRFEKTYVCSSIEVFL